MKRLLDEEARMLWRLAGNDLIAGKATMSTGLALATVGFHAQQAVEKSLKSVMTARGAPYPLTHDIRRLVQRVVTIEPSLNLDIHELSKLSIYAIQTRYDDEPLLSLAGAMHAVRLAEDLHHTVAVLLKFADESGAHARGQLHAVVMAGGSGTRFWPKSRRNRPKQLLRLHGDATMLQQTVDRVAPLVPPSRTYIITGADQAEATKGQLPDLPPGNIVAEPCPRDTAACVGLAALIVAKADPDGTMIVMPADHVIQPREKFLATVEAAQAVIDADPTAFVTFGIKPTRAETGYGYIERGESLGLTGGIALHRVAQFREKPDRETAEAFLADGRFAWNSGIFVWRARAILDALKVHRPGLHSALERVGAALGTPREAEVIAREYPEMEKVPIDKAVMERASNVRVLEVVYDWNDVGDWRALTTLAPADTDGNTVQGSVHAVDTRGSIIVSDDGGLIATLGVDDLVIVQSGGATLVASKDHLDRLKALVEGLDKAGFGSTL